MIIIKAKNTTHFINEAEVLQIMYFDDIAKVNVWPKRWTINDKQSWFSVDNVESVEYVNQAQPAKYTFTAPKLKGAYDDELVKEALFDEIDRLDTAERDRRRGNGQAACKSGSADRFLNVCEAHDIQTVGQLLYVGRRDFERYRKMGRGCVDSVATALKNLYDIDF
jgi:hypothetical protein